MTMHVRPAAEGCEGARFWGAIAIPLVNLPSIALCQKFPDIRGIARLTRAALSADGQHALVYLENSCGGACGMGALYYLTRYAAGWKIESRQVLWIS